MDITSIKNELKFLVKYFDDYDVKGYLEALVQEIEAQEVERSDG
jgi:hypothetical protein